MLLVGCLLLVFYANIFYIRAYLRLRHPDTLNRYISIVAFDFASAVVIAVYSLSIFVCLIYDYYYFFLPSNRIE